MQIITVTAILLASLNVSNNVSDFAYNTECSGNEVTSTFVYKKSDNGKYLSHHLKYNYTYDEQQRLIKKEVLRWNIYSEEWQKSYCLNYIYSDFGYSIEYALWNKSKSDYTDLVAKQTYDEIFDDAVTIASYQWNNTNNNWDMQDNIVMMNQGEKLLSSLELVF